MADKDTVSPYDDEVADPYAADDTKNPHEPGGEALSEEETSKSAPRKATRTTKTVKKT